MPAPFFPQSKCLLDATAAQTALAMSELHLFKAGFVPNPATVIADLTANECDFTTYVLQIITAWLSPVASDQGGYQITAPTEQWSLAAVPAITNMVGGYWLETMGGDVQLIRQFDAPVPMVTTGNFVQVTSTIVFPN